MRADADGEEFDAVLRHLRGLAGPCRPPVGVGSFDVLYASEREIVVWYSPARDDHHAGEVTLPCPRLVAAWAALRAGEVLDEPALERFGEGASGGRWLLAVLAQLPAVRVRTEPLALEWPPLEPPAEDVTDVAAPISSRRQRPTRRARDGQSRP